MCGPGFKKMPLPFNDIGLVLHLQHASHGGMRLQHAVDGKLPVQRIFDECGKTPADADADARRSGISEKLFEQTYGGAPGGSGGIRAAVPQAGQLHYGAGHGLNGAAFGAALILRG